jgi:hypothetical protein
MEEDIWRVGIVHDEEIAIAAQVALIKIGFPGARL